MEHNEVDITHTVKASEAKGGQLIKNLDTGETRWVGRDDTVACDDEEHDLEPKPPLPPLEEFLTEIDPKEHKPEPLANPELVLPKSPTKAELKKLEQQLKALNKTHQD